MTKRCGTVALVGRPNMGKSTLLNRLVGEKIAITAHRPQTTRHAVRGISTKGDDQFIYLDTPGLHGGGKKALNRVLNRTARGSLLDADVVVLMVQALQWTEDDQLALDAALRSDQPLILVINKLDKIGDKKRMLPYLQGLPSSEKIRHIVPVSAKSGEGVEVLEELIAECLPEGEHIYDADELTDKNERFLAAEFVREQLTRQLNEELPYALTVEIERFDHEPTGYRISAAVWVERDSQKGIVIGQRGEKLKEVGRRSRESMSELFGVPVFLELWVKVRKDWSDDVKALQALGFQSE